MFGAIGRGLKKLWACGESADVDVPNSYTPEVFLPLSSI